VRRFTAGPTSLIEDGVITVGPNLRGDDELNATALLRDARWDRSAYTP
jgi:hypothetical protein